MRIGNKLPATEIDKKEKKAKSASQGTGSTRETPFAAQLTSARIREVQEAGLELKQLKDEIDKAATSLDREPTIANFRVFRDLLGKFGKKASTEAYRVERVKSSGITPQEHELITVIDKEADELYHLIVSEQKDRLAITGKIMRIKGLVVNFMT